MRAAVMHRPLDTLRRRSRQSGDPVNAGRRHVLGIASYALEYWVPAFAGTTTECVATIRLLRNIGLSVLALTTALASPATAQDLRGKDINLYVGSGAGGPYDA